MSWDFDFQAKIVTNCVSLLWVQPKFRSESRNFLILEDSNLYQAMILCGNTPVMNGVRWHHLWVATDSCTLSCTSLLERRKLSRVYTKPKWKFSIENPYTAWRSYRRHSLVIKVVSFFTISFFSDFGSSNTSRMSGVILPDFNSFTDPTWRMKDVAFGPENICSRRIAKEIVLEIFCTS